MGIELNQYRASIGFNFRVYAWTKSSDGKMVNDKKLDLLISRSIFFLQIIVISVLVVLFGSFYQIYHADKQSNSYVSAQGSVLVFNNILTEFAKNCGISTSGLWSHLCLSLIHI